jgi:hypothetical protein
MILRYAAMKVYPCTMQELHALIQYIQFNKASDSDWFTINPPQNNGQNWSGKCW